MQHGPESLNILNLFLIFVLGNPTGKIMKEDNPNLAPYLENTSPVYIDTITVSIFLTLGANDQNKLLAVCLTRVTQIKVTNLLHGVH